MAKRRSCHFHPRRAMRGRGHGAGRRGGRPRRPANNRAQGPLRWGDPEKRLLRQYHDDNLIDTTRLYDIEYMHELHESEVL